MAEKVKKKPSFFLSFKRSASHKAEESGIPITSLPQTAPPMFRSSQNQSRPMNSGMDTIKSRK